jgi:hypothetical protein
LSNTDRPLITSILKTVDPVDEVDRDDSEERHNEDETVEQEEFRLQSRFRYTADDVDFLDEKVINELGEEQVSKLSLLEGTKPDLPLWSSNRSTSIRESKHGMHQPTSSGPIHERGQPTGERRRRSRHIWQIRASSSLVELPSFESPVHGVQ